VLKQIEGSRPVAEAVAMCRPQVICAYPITPQTHIVEALGALVKRQDFNTYSREISPGWGFHTSERTLGRRASPAFTGEPTRQLGRQRIHRSSPVRSPQDW
jgi:hypothetical protein